MAKRTRGRTPPPPAPKGNGDALSSFLASVDRFAETVSGQILVAVGEGSDRLVIQSTGESFIAQTRRVTDYLRETTPGMAPAQSRELGQFLRIQDGDALVERALKVTTQTLAAGGNAVTQGFLSWLNEIMLTLKKIIRKIFDLFFGGMPKWLDAILVIIDELLNLLKTLFGGQSGLKMSEVADQASREEVNFLREMTALAELEAAQRPNRASEDDASN